MMWRLSFFLAPYLAAFLEWFLYVRLAKPGRAGWWGWGAAAFLAASKSPGFLIFGGYDFSPDLPTWVFAVWTWLEGCVWTGLPCTAAAAIAVAAFRSRRAAARAFAAAAAAAALLAGYGTFNGLRVPATVEREIWLPDLPEAFDGYRIAHLSDLHCSAGARRRKIGKIVERTNAAEADLIALTGDFADGLAERWAAELEPLRGLKARDGVYASTGNHERYWRIDEWAPHYREWGLRFLRNEFTEVRRGDEALEIGGLDDPALGGAPWRLGEGEGDGFRILLFHRPIWCEELGERHGVRLQLSGHTHGGGAPGVGRLVGRANDGHVRGLYRIGGMTLHVSPGSGQWGGFAMRFADPAEITVLVLRWGKPGDMGPGGDLRGWGGASGIFQ